MHGFREGFLGLILSIFVSRCSTVPSPRQIHIDNSQHDINPPEDLAVIINFDDLSPSGKPINLYHDLEWSSHFRSVGSEFLSSSPSNAAFAFAADSPAAAPFFRVHPGSRYRSFSLLEFELSPASAPNVWPPRVFICTMTAWPVDGGGKVVRKFKVGGLDNYQFPVKVYVAGVTGVVEVEVEVEAMSMSVVEGGGEGVQFPFALDDVKIVWEGYGDVGEARKQLVVVN